MAEKTRFRVNIKTGEIEIEGDQAFVEGQISKLPTIVNTITSGGSISVSKAARKPKAVKKTSQLASTAKPTEKQKKVQSTTNKRGRKTRKKALETDKEFIEWMKNYKTGLKQVDYVLLSGYYIQKRTKSESFRTADISKLLKMIDKKVSNITSTLYLLNRNKKLDITEKKGRTSYFKVTASGEKYLVTLIKK